MRKELIKKLEERGEKPEKLRKRYKKQIEKIKENFPKESAQRILKDLSYEDFLKETLEEKLLKDRKGKEG